MNSLPQFAALSEEQLKQSLYLTALLALLLPPFIGGTLMGIMGFYPLPEFYLIFTSYAAPYVATVVSVVLLLLPRLHRRLISLPGLPPEQAMLHTRKLFARLPWYFLFGVTLYSTLGALSADLSLESLGHADYTLRQHLLHQFGIIPVVLLTTFPIFFFSVDCIGRYLAPRGLTITAVPLAAKMGMLGIIFPTLISSTLIGYYYNRHNDFTLEALILLCALTALAVGATLLTWHSFRQGLSPLLRYIDSHAGHTDITLPSIPEAISLDELGVLTTRFAALSSTQNRLTLQLQEAEALSRTVIDQAGALVMVLDPDGRITHFNQACEALSGYRAGEVIGCYPWENVLPADEAEAVRKFAFEALAHDPSRLAGRYTNHWQSRDGSRHLIDWRNTVIPDEQGKMRYMIAVGIDIGAQRTAEETLRNSREQLNEAQRLARVGSWTLEIKSGTLEWSDEIYRLFELDKSRFTPSYEAFLNIIHPDDREMVNDAYTTSLKSRQPYEVVHRLKFADGRIKHVREACETLYDEAGDPLLSRGTVQDITDQVLAEETINLYANVFRHSAEAIIITDHDNHIVAVNPALVELTGYTPEELIGKNPRVLSSGHTPQQTYHEMWQSLHETGHWQGELSDRRKNGEIYPKWATLSVIRNTQGTIINYIANFSDITERKASEQRIHHLAHHDMLTGLFNRFSLEERLGQAMVQARRSYKQLAVMFIDMDRFKSINDTLGHHVGDALLIEVAKRLKGAVRESDIVARLGGDEFIVVLTQVAEDAQVRHIARNIVDILNSPYQVHGHDLRSSPSIGIAFFPSDGKSIEGLMKSADTAMYHAKSAGRNNYQFFTTEMNLAVQEGMALEHDLHRALERGEFTLHYQPKVAIDSGSITGVEALLRWTHPQRGPIPPDTFIPVAEESGLIITLGEWVLDTACQQLVEWRKAGLPLTMAVNLSPKQLRDPTLIERLQAILQRHGIGENELELEITESSIMENPEQAITLMESIRGMGITLSIDDFGTGYSSLAYLKLLPIQTLKLDRTFVSDIGHDESGTTICKAAISLAHSLSLQIVAEGVETEIQRTFLTDHRCNTLQGFLFSRPLPPTELTPLLSERHPMGA